MSTQTVLQALSVGGERMIHSFILHPSSHSAKHIIHNDCIDPDFLGFAADTIQ